MPLTACRVDRKGLVRYSRSTASVGGMSRLASLMDGGKREWRGAGDFPLRPSWMLLEAGPQPEAEGLGVLPMAGQVQSVFLIHKRYSKSS